MAPASTYLAALNVDGRSVQAGNIRGNLKKGNIDHDYFLSFLGKCHHTGLPGIRSDACDNCCLTEEPHPIFLLYKVFLLKEDIPIVINLIKRFKDFQR